MKKRTPLFIAFLSAFLLLLTPLGSTSAQTEVEIKGNVVSSVSSTKSKFVSNRNTVPADGTTVAILTVTVLTNGGQPLPDKTVLVTSSRGSSLDLIRCYNGQVLTTSNQGTTDSSGQVICAVSSTVIGEATFSAIAEGVPIAAKPVVNFVEVVGIPPPPPGVDKPPVTPPQDQEPPRGIIERITDEIKRIAGEIGKVLEDAPKSVLGGGTGLLIIIPNLVLIPLASSISAALMAGIPAIQYLLLSALPSLRPPRKWGVVRDATSSVPIPGVFVDLYDAATQKRVKRIMTDKTGRFGFLNPASGQFWVEIQSPLYRLFKTEVFDVADFGDRPISFDVYLHPIEKAMIASLKKVVNLMHFVSIVKLLQLLILLGGSVIAIALLINAQTTENGLLITLYALLWVLRFLSTSSYSQSGHIVELDTTNAINQAVVQVTSTKKGETQFIHSTISDESGRFLILVPPGKYMVIATKEEYQPSEKQVKGEIQSVEMNLKRLSAPAEALDAAPA